MLADKDFTNTDDFLMKEVELIISEFEQKDEQFSLLQNVFIFFFIFFFYFDMTKRKIKLQTYKYHT